MIKQPMRVWSAAEVCAAVSNWNDIPKLSGVLSEFLNSRPDEESLTEVRGALLDRAKSCLQNHDSSSMALLSVILCVLASFANDKILLDYITSASRRKEFKSPDVLVSALTLRMINQERMNALINIISNYQHLDGLSPQVAVTICPFMFNGQLRNAVMERLSNTSFNPAVSRNINGGTCNIF